MIIRSLGDIALSSVSKGEVTARITFIDESRYSDLCRQVNIFINTTPSKSAYFYQGEKLYLFMSGKRTYTAGAVEYILNLRYSNLASGVVSDESTLFEQTISTTKAEINSVSTIATAETQTIKISNTAVKGWADKHVKSDVELRFEESRKLRHANMLEQRKLSKAYKREQAAIITPALNYTYVKLAAKKSLSPDSLPDYENARRVEQNRVKRVNHMLKARKRQDKLKRIAVRMERKAGETDVNH